MGETSEVMAMDESDQEECSFLGLPTEVRVQILEKLESVDLMAMRLVNTQCQQEIEEHLDFSVRLDQCYRGFRKLCRHRVKTCKVKNLTHQHLHKERGPLFSHPSRLKKLVLDGNISVSNLAKIFQHCLEIEKLSITHETMGITSLLHTARIQQCLNNNLNHLTHLEVQLIRCPTPASFPFQLQNDDNMNVIFALSLPNLTSFKLYYSLCGNYQKLLVFLARHSATLKELELQVGDRGDLRNTQAFVSSHRAMQSAVRNTVDMDALRAMQLTKLNFRDDVLNANNQFLQKIIFDILERQKRLQEFQFHSRGVLSIEMLKNIVANNEASLSELVVYSLREIRTVYAAPVGGVAMPGIGPDFRFDSIPLDMSMFQKCSRLKTLALSYHNRLDNGMEVGSPKMVNLHLIPRSVERMHLTGYLLDVHEVGGMAHTCLKLKELLIADAGTMKYSTVLASILRHCKELEYLNIRPVITRANGDAGWWVEVEELSKFYNRFMGIPFDPIDDLDGFEATIKEEDRDWLIENVSAEENPG